MTISFRFATKTDRQSAIQLWHDAGLTRPHNDPDLDFGFAVEAATSEILLAEQNGIIIGTCMVGHDGHRGAIYYLAVKPTHQGKGLGKQIMQQAEDYLVSQGVWKINLFVRHGNENVLNFYDKQGYAPNAAVSLAKIIDKSKVPTLRDKN
ncbi:MAG: GNAT family acetyltransferase [Rhizobiales bacterium]|nr:GNAT family acetyltransferase [Hyphomicrobiales bacterium]NRB13445.1 GNAT family acetyltransferase [Hyphomicrobiales bacterium]